MVKHIQSIRRLLPKNSLNVFDHFVKLAIKGLTLCVWYGVLKYTTYLKKLHLKATGLFNPLSTNTTKWSNTPKQTRRICL